MTSASGFVGTPAEGRSLFRTLQQQDRRNGQREQHEKNAGLGVASLVAFDGEHLAPGTEAGTEAAVKATRETEAEAKATTTGATGTGVMGTKATGTGTQGKTAGDVETKVKAAPRKMAELLPRRDDSPEEMPRLVFEAVRVGNSARTLHRGAPLNAFGAAVQTWHETGGFRSAAMRRTWNLAGIKCTRSWVAEGGLCWNSATKEWVGGAERRVEAAFRHYRSLEHFLADYSRLLATCFPLAARNADCCWLFFAGLSWGAPRKDGTRLRWATDPNYSASLVRAALTLAPSLLGGAWKDILRCSFSAARSRGFPDAALEALIRAALAEGGG
ncbi:glucosaminidase domain-containing protein [Aminiphilus sp.]|uniref:glucosaminidase domain-containing protein n=1 Tax=Aminiphilus sp. TaxID=1872488 RepID=UPI002605EF7D|nr:glucosaminidase domain-containing protein [Aminiphilus sp.]